MNKNQKVLLSLIPLGAGIWYTINGFDSRDQFLKERLKQMEEEKSKTVNKASHDSNAKK